MFDLDRFFADCRDAVTADPSHRLVREVVARVVSEPDAVLDGTGRTGARRDQCDLPRADLTVLNVIWGPGMTIMPHDHRMWAVIGVYTGREDNIFWRRLPGAMRTARSRRRAPRRCARGDCTPLGHDIIHSVTNPIAAADRRDPRLWRRLLRRRNAASGTPRRCTSVRTTWRRRGSCSRIRIGRWRRGSVSGQSRQRCRGGP